MKSLLLTGATGMLGHFLLKELLQSDIELAVLVRSKRHLSAHDRVEQLVAGIEQQIGKILPRPKVIEGDLQKSHLSLAEPHRSWLLNNCQTVINSAASVKFYSDNMVEGDQKNDAESPFYKRLGEYKQRTQFEPYRSNVAGTKNLLELLRSSNVEQLHHVSTAYVCGNMRGVVDERPVTGTSLKAAYSNPGFGNDYEASKFESELLVQSADWIKSRTTYRPSIIVGCADTGFSPSFHAIYTTLQLGNLFLIGVLRQGHTNLTAAQIRQIIDDYFVRQLSLNGDEQKNLVPAGWVAETILGIVNRPELHNETYNLTNSKAVSLQQLIDSMTVAAMNNLEQAKSSSAGIPDDLLQLSGFKSHMKTYQAYFKSDPDFSSRIDSPNSALRKCPQLDHDALVRLWNFAIQANFSTPRQSTHRAPVTFKAKELIETALCADTQTKKNDDNVAVQPNSRISKALQICLQVNGRHGGNWILEAKQAGDSNLISVIDSKDAATEEKPRIVVNSQNLESIVKQETSIETALYNGLLYIELPLSLTIKEGNSRSNMQGLEAATKAILQSLRMHHQKLNSNGSSITHRPVRTSQTTK